MAVTYNGRKLPRQHATNSWVEDQNATMNTKPKSLNYSDDPKTQFAESELWNTMKPLFLTMSVFGLFFPPRADGVNCPKYKSIQKIFRTYSFLMCALLLGNFVKYCFAFSFTETFGESLFFKISLHSFFCQALIQAVCCAHAFYCKNQVSLLFVQWIDAMAKEKDHFPKQNKVVKLFVVVSISLVLTSAGVYGYALFLDEYMSSVFLLPFKPAGNLLMLTQGITLFVVTMCMAAWLFPLIFMIIMAKILGSGFANFNTKLQKEIDEDIKLTGRIKTLRHAHQRLCTMTDTADDIFKFMAAAFLMFSCLQILLILYVMITTNGASAQLITGHLFSLLNVFIGLVIFCLSAGSLNHQAHEAKKLLYRVELGDDDEESKEFLVFLSRVEGSSIGLSVLDMFVIDKPTILTIFGALVSYFMILLTFTPGNESCNTSSDGSKTLVFLREINGTYVTTNVTV